MHVPAADRRAGLPSEGREAKEDTPFDQLPSLAGIGVLIVDDEPNTREVIAAILSARGAEVRAVGSAREALDAFDAAIPDVIISDIGMPGEDGYSLIRAIRSRDSEHGGQTPAIALTAYASARDSLAARAAGYHRHMRKPIVPAELVGAVAEIRALRPVS
jgi:CheY-like chemotaxis protein